MEEFKGTPGPWVYSKKRHTHDCVIHTEKAREEFGYISPENGGVIGSSEWIWINDADAKLIAAAPELLDACRQFIYSIENNDKQELNNAYTSAVEAVKKALES